MEKRFDPMTGEPIVSDESVTPTSEQIPTSEQAPASEQAPTPEPVPAPGPIPTAGPIPTPGTVPQPAKKNGWVKGLAIGVAAVAAVVVVGLVVRSAIIGKGGKILIATANTFKDTPTIIKEANLDSAAKLVASGKYSVVANVDAEGDGFEGRFVSTPKEKQLSGKIDIEGVSVDGMIGMTDKQVKAYVPLIGDDTYVYNYTNDDQDGYILDMLDEAGVSVEDINSALQQIYNAENQVDSKATKQLSKDLVKQFNSIKWEKADKKKCKVDGKQRNVKGYKAEITGDDIEAMVQIIEDYYSDQFDSMDYLDDMDVNMDEYDEMFAEIYDACDEMDDIEVAFYIYKNKLAAIYIDADEATGEILFMGGDYRLQNVECTFEDDWDDVSFEIEGSSKGSVETLEFTVDGDTALELEYDSKKGDFTIGNDSAEYDGTLKKNGKGFDFSIDVEEVEIAFSITEDAKLVKYEGEEIDITELDEDDLYDIAMDLYDNAY